MHLDLLSWLGVELLKRCSFQQLLLPEKKLKTQFKKTKINTTTPSLENDKIKHLSKIFINLWGFSKVTELQMNPNSFSTCHTLCK